MTNLEPRLIHGAPMLAVDDGYHIEKNGIYYGQVCFLPDTMEQVLKDIENGVFVVVADEKPLSDIEVG